LGSAVTDEAVDPLIVTKIEELNSLKCRLQHAKSHFSYFILKNCMGTQKVTYIARTSRTFQRPEIQSQYDEALQSAIESTTNISLAKEKWKSASLPIKQGGIGIRRITDIGLPAYISSLHSSSSGVDRLLGSDSLHNTINVAESLWAESESSSPQGDQVSIQSK
jgi:hypothetical protein